METNNERRRFLHKSWRYGLGLMLIPMVTQSCKSGGDEGSEEDASNALEVSSCDDLSKTPDSEIKKREGFGYVEESPIPEKHCKNCQLYLPPKEGQNCGGCALFKGPVFEEAYCTYWAPIV